MYFSFTSPNVFYFILLFISHLLASLRECGKWDAYAGAVIPGYLQKSGETGNKSNMEHWFMQHRDKRTGNWGTRVYTETETRFKCISKKARTGRLQFFQKTQRANLDRTYIYCLHQREPRASRTPHQHVSLQKPYTQGTMSLLMAWPSISQEAPILCGGHSNCMCLLVGPLMEFNLGAATPIWWGP